MRPASWIAAALSFCAASPALASGTILCRSTISPTDGPQLWLTIGSGPGTGVVQARLTQGNEGFTTGVGDRAPVLTQSWLDRNSLRVAIVDANAETEIARLETWRRSGSACLGTLRYAGRTWRVRCTEEG